MLDMLQDICLGHHKIYILAIQYKMRKMHNECDTIPPYIKVLEEPQQQAKRAKMPIDDATLVM